MQKSNTWLYIEYPINIQCLFSHIFYFIFPLYFDWGRSETQNVTEIHFANFHGGSTAIVENMEITNLTLTFLRFCWSLSHCWHLAFVWKHPEKQKKEGKNSLLSVIWNNTLNQNMSYTIFWYNSRPNLDKKRVRLYDVALSHEIITVFVVKALEKCLYWNWCNFKCPFLEKNCPFSLTKFLSNTVLIF